MPRFFLPPDAWKPPFVLTGEEARHAAQVMRVSVGDGLTVFDGRGRLAAARVRSVARERVELDLEPGSERGEDPPRPLIRLALGVPKGKTMDLVVQKAVELGVAEIQPLVTRHTVVQPGEGKAAKWRRVALEACKQCGQDHLPEIAEPATPEAWLAGRARGGVELIASLAAGALPLREVLETAATPETATILIGPEGDFSEAETRQALAAGFIPVSLGATVLRVETAALFALSVLRYRFSLAAG